MKNHRLKFLVLTLAAALVLAGVPALALATPVGSPLQQGEPTSDVLTPEALANMTYRSELAASGEVTLVDGKFEDTENRILVGLAAETIVYGELDGQEAVALLVYESGGGSGIFTNLAVVVDQDGAPVNVASTLLGDRVKVNSLAIENDQIIVEMVQQGSNDPMCCPTELVRETYVLEGDQLILVEEVVLGSAPQVFLTQSPETGYQTIVLPPAPYDGSASPIPTGAPLHTVLVFGDNATADLAQGAPYIAVYPVDETIDLWEESGDFTITDLIAELQRVLADQPETLSAPLPIAPPVEADDLAAQVSYLSGDGYSGVRFVARATQAGALTDDDQLAYYFSGLTDDGRYLIAAQWPVETTAAIDALDAATDDAWTPTLSALDAIVAALDIQAPAPPISADDLANTTYQSMLLEKPVLLVNGIYTETVVPDSASGVTTVLLLDEPMAFGKVESFDAAAVLIVENGGGSGNFVSLALVQKIGGDLVNTANAFLGDRPRVTNLAINADGSITVDLVQVGPSDAFCCPTMPMSVTFIKVGDALIYQDQVSATIDASGFADQVNASVVQPTAYDNSVPPSGQGEPKHFVWTFGEIDETLQPMFSSSGYVGVYPVEAYKAIWEEAGDPFVDNALAALETLLAEQPANPPPPLPVLPQIGAVNDFATQVSYLDLPDGGVGVRFVGRFVQDVTPIENYQLRYVFQGLSADGQFLIVASLPVTTTALSAEPQPIGGEEYDQFVAVYDMYLTEMTALFDSLSSTDFTPDLAVLDAMLQSVTPAFTVNPLAPSSLANMEVKSELTADGVALLVNGVYTEPVAPGSATVTEIQLLPAPIAYGELDGQGAAAVLLAENGGGSGTFINLAAIVDQDGAPVHVASAPLGDRVEVQRLEIADNQITLLMLTQGPDDPMCCPSLAVIQVYELQDETLVLVDETTDIAGDSEAALAGTTWTWVETLMNDDSVKTPATEGAFVLTFGADGTAGATTDCNTFAGSYTEGAEGLSIELPISTAMACLEETQEQEFIADVTSINGYIITDDGMLALLLPFDSGSMIFAPADAGEAMGAMDSPVVDAPTSLPGTAWNWLQTQYSNDFVAAPADPTVYVLTFGTDGTVNVQDDCNVLNGAYTAGDNGELTIDLQTTTMAACSPGSLHDQFILDLSGVASYLLEDGRLFAAIKFDTGVMEFALAE